MARCEAVTRYKVVPGNWASVRGGKYHLLPADTAPTITDYVTSLCGIRFVPLNVTCGDAPPTHDGWICSKCCPSVAEEPSGGAMKVSDLACGDWYRTPHGTVGQYKGHWYSGKNGAPDYVQLTDEFGRTFAAKIATIVPED